MNRIQGGKMVYYCESCGRVPVDALGWWCQGGLTTTKPVSVLKAFFKWVKGLF